VARFNRLSVLVLLIALTGANSSAVDHFYVSPAGNDNWSGRLPAPNAFGTDGPLRTPEGARARVRAFKLQNGNSFPRPVEVQFREGTYRLTETWELNAPDSGVPGRPVTYRNYPGEDPVISGGEVLGGWEEAGHLWKTTLPAVASGDWWFSVIFVDGELRLPARAPNPVGDPRDTNGDGFFNITEAPEDSPETIGFTPGDVVPYTNPDDVYFFFPHAWEVSKHRIDTVDFENNRVTFRDIRPGPGVNHPPFGLYDSNQRFAVYHAREALDRPGEWWLDRSTGTLYYFPFPGETPGETEIVAPRVEKLVYLNAFAGNPIRHVHFEGLTFKHANYALGPNGSDTLQGLDNVAAQKGIGAALTGAGYRQGSITGCTFTELANFGVLLQYDCDNVTIARNHLHEIGGGGIDVGRDFTNTGAVTVENNWVHDAAKFVPSVPAIRIGDSPGNTVAHNRVSRHPYTGIWVGWVVGYQPSATSDNWIHHNHISHIGGDLMSDLGGIYTVSIAPGTVIEHNLIHDVAVYDRGYGGWGIYLDEGSSDMTVRNNLVYATEDGGFHLHYGRDNLVTNNIFAWGHEHQIERTRIELFGNSFAFRNNIVYFNTDRYMAGAWTDLRYLFRDNLIFDAAGYPFFFTQDFTLGQWQALGQEVGTVIADPLFTDPANFDFTLDPQSPAVTQTGFVPFDASDAGLTGDPAWTGGPDQLDHPPTTLPLAPEQIPYHFGFEEETLSEDWKVIASGNTFVAPSTDNAHTGSRSLLMQDSAVAGDAAEPVAYLEPRYRFGQATLRFWVNLSNNARLAMEWRERNTNFVGPNFIVDGANLRINGSGVTPFPRNEWVQIEITTTLGDESDGRFDLRMFRQGQGWQSFNNRAYRDSGFRRLDFLSYFNTSTSDTRAYLDEVELFTDHAIFPEPPNEPPYITGAWVDGPNVVRIAFTESMNPATGTAGAAHPGNYTVGGLGRGTLPPHPASATVNGNEVVLVWEEGKMFAEGPLTVTVAADVTSVGGKAMTPYRVALTQNNGQAVPAQPVPASTYTTATNDNPLLFTVDFGETVQGFGPANLNIGGATLAGMTPAGNAASYEVRLLPTGTGAGTVTLAATAEHCTDLAGNPCIDGTATASATYDYVPPVAVLTTSEPPVTNNRPMRFTVDFGKTVTGLGAGSIVVTNGTAGGVAPPGNAAAYAFEIDPVTNGIVTVQVPAGAVTDAAGNPNTASTTLLVIFDGDPVAVIGAVPDQSGPVNTHAMRWTVTFNKPVTGFTAAALSLAEGFGTIQQPAGNGDGTVYTVDVTDIPEDGAVRLAVHPVPDLLDAAGNALESDFIGDAVIIDRTPPEILIAPISPKTFTCGEGAEPPLIFAYDAIDGDLADAVTVDGELPGPLSPPGDYPVTYSVSDTAGNETTITWIIEIDDNCPLTVVAETIGAERQAGENHQFRVEAFGALGHTVYQWYRVTEQKSLSPIPGANSNVYFLNQVGQGDAGNYLCIVSDAVTSVPSPVMTLAVMGQLPLAQVPGLAALVLLLAAAGTLLLARNRDGAR